MKYREMLGRLVREAWVTWAREQPDVSARSSWLLPWEDIDDGQREVDMRIGEAVAAAERERIAKLAENVGATRSERCRDPAHAQMVHAIRALGSGGGHAVPFAGLLRDEVAREAEVLHAEHHPGLFVPSLDSCREHDRAGYEQVIRDLHPDLDGEAP